MGRVFFLLLLLFGKDYKNFDNVEKLFSRVMNTVSKRITLYASAVLIFLILTTAFDCAKKESPVAPGPNPLQLTVQSVTCTETFLKLSLNSGETQRTLSLQRGDSTIATMMMSGSDSVFIDQGLLPNKTYIYTLTRPATQQSVEWQTTAQATTLDTTSSDFNWDVETFGIGYSYLFDVAIVNDTLAYAVGAIYQDDSTGQYDPNAYNLLKWDGKEWELIKVMFPLCDGNGNQEGAGSYSAEGIFDFSINDVWISCLGSMAHWDGKHFQQFCMPLGYDQRDLGKMWGISDKLYLVGTNGFIAFYNGISWQQIPTNLTTDIHDVSGGSNPAIGQNVVLATMCSKYTYGDARVLRISSTNQLDSIYWGSNLYPPYSVWFDSTSQVYVCGGGIFKLQNGQWVSIANGLPSIWLNRVRGNGDNDLVVAGDYGVVAHYNGVRWQTYDQLRLPDGNYESIAIHNNLVIAVGGNDGLGYIAVGRR
jgi:hypothetical protein